MQELARSIPFNLCLCSGLNNKPPPQAASTWNQIL